MRRDSPGSFLAIALFIGACSSDVEKLCDKALDCGWLRGELFRGQAQSMRVSLCQQRVSELIKPLRDCIACNMPRKCGDGACDCLKAAFVANYNPLPPGPWNDWGDGTYTPRSEK